MTCAHDLKAKKQAADSPALAKQAVPAASPTPKGGVPPIRFQASSSRSLSPTKVSSPRQNLKQAPHHTPQLAWDMPTQRKDAFLAPCTSKKAPLAGAPLRRAISGKIQKGAGSQARRLPEPPQWTGLAVPAAGATEPGRSLRELFEAGHRVCDDSTPQARSAHLDGGAV